MLKPKPSRSRDQSRSRGPEEAAEGGDDACGGSERRRQSNEKCKHCGDRERETCRRLVSSFYVQQHDHDRDDFSSTMTRPRASRGPSASLKHIRATHRHTQRPSLLTYLLRKTHFASDLNAPVRSKPRTL